VNGQFDYQIGGAYTPSSSVKIVDRDISNSPVSGLYSICYINAFQTQPDAKTWWTKNHSNLLLKKNGQLVEDPEWKGEYILDTRTDENRQALLDIVGGWIDTCANKGLKYKNIESNAFRFQRN
jgi:hypothetical protein